MTDQEFDQLEPGKFYRVKVTAEYYNNHIFIGFAKCSAPNRLICIVLLDTSGFIQSDSGYSYIETDSFYPEEVELIDEIQARS